MKNNKQKWYIPVNENNFAELEAWWKQHTQHTGWPKLPHSSLLLSEHPDDDSYFWGGSEESLNNAYPSYQKITLEEFRVIANSLPEHWYIKATEENIEELNRWRLSKRTIDAQQWDSRFVPGATLLSKHPEEDDGSYFWLKHSNWAIKHPEYKPITIEQFRQITNSTSNPKPMTKPEVKTIQISRTLLNQYYDAATVEQREYIINHFKLDGTTTDKAIRELHDLACKDWKPKIKANHPDCFPEDSKYFDFSKYVDQHGCNGIVSSNVADSLGLCKNFIQVRGSSTKTNLRAFYLTSEYNWELIKEGGATVLIPTKM